MPDSSQFFFFYTDELVQHHWVDWVEGPLSAIPAPEFQDARGFQNSIGDLGAGPRTRAGEAYKLGLLTGRLVRKQSGGTGIPVGWQKAISGTAPATKLGWLAYLIGKALRSGSDSPSNQEAINCISSLMILHIGFSVNERWFSTVLLFQFAVDELERRLERELSHEEIRYLSAAVINTLDSDEYRHLLLGPYTGEGELESLIFSMQKGGVVEFNLIGMPEIVRDKSVGINQVEKAKAALFWAAPKRGIYSRSSNPEGLAVIRNLVDVDRELRAKGLISPIETHLRLIAEENSSSDIFGVANKEYSSYPDLFDSWQVLEEKLYTLVSNLVSESDVPSLPEIWGIAQHHIRNLDFSLDLVIENKDGNGEVQVVVEPHQESITDYIEANFDQLVSAVPVRKPKQENQNESTKKVRVSQIDFAAKEKVNRKLGAAGEEFIVEYEKGKLIKAGRPDLAEKVVWASKDIGDGLGFDIISYTPEGTKIFIEVKTTNGGEASPFFVSANELRASEEFADNYYLYRVFNFSKNPKFYILHGALEGSIELVPTTYRAAP